MLIYRKYEWHHALILNMLPTAFLTSNYIPSNIQEWVQECVDHSCVEKLVQTSDPIECAGINTAVNIPVMCEASCGGFSVRLQCYCVRIRPDRIGEDLHNGASSRTCSLSWQLVAWCTRPHALGQDLCVSTRLRVASFMICAWLWYSSTEDVHSTFVCVQLLPDDKLFCQNKHVLSLVKSYCLAITFFKKALNLYLLFLKEPSTHAYCFLR